MGLKNILSCSAHVVMLGVALFKSPVSVLDGLARKGLIETSFALQREQLGRRGPIRLGDIIPFRSKPSEKEAEATARLLSPDCEEVWGRNAFSGIRMKGRMSHLGYRCQEKIIANNCDSLTDRPGR